MNRLLATIARPWNALFHRPSGPTDLGVCRAVFFGGLLLHSLGRTTDLWAQVPEAFWMPLPLFRWLRVPVLPAEVLVVLDWAWKIAMALACLGWRTRTASVVAFVVGAYVLGLPHNFGKTHHSDAIIVFATALLAFSRCGDAFSVDAWLATRRGDARAPPSGEYTWPIRGVQFLVVVIYFGAGLSKMRGPGLEWAFSDNLSYLLVQHHVSGNDPLVPWGLSLARVPWMCTVFAALSLALELAAPLALTGRTARAIIAPGLFGMQLAIWALMGVMFLELLLCFAFFVPWSSLARLRSSPVAAITG